MYTVDNVFSTPIYSSMVDNLDEIQDEISSKLTMGLFQNLPEILETNLKTSNPNYFDGNVVDRLNLQSVKKMIHKHLEHYCKEIEFDLSSHDYDLSSWFFLMDAGVEGQLHTQGSADISGCYYFKTTGDDGSIFFETPAPAASSSRCFSKYSSRKRYKPKIGKLLMFPGWLYHGIGTNKTHENRISLAFNVNFRKK